MVTKIKCTIIFLMVFILIPVQVKAEEPDENVEVVNDVLEETQKEKEADAKSETLIDDETVLQEVPAENEEKTYLQEKEDDVESDLPEEQEEYEVPPNETTGTEFSYSVVPSPNVEITDGKWKVIKNKKYVLSITITNNSPSDWEEVLVKANMYSEFDSDYNYYYKFLSFYPQNGVTVRDFSADGLSPIEIDAEAVVALLKSGDSITLQAEVVIPTNWGDTATLVIDSELYPGAPFGYVVYDLLLVDEKNPVQDPTPKSGTKPNTKTVTKTNGKESTIKTAAKTGDNSSTTLYLGVITLSALTIILCRKRKIYK